MFKLEHSQTKNDGWVLTDTENLIVIEFIERKFNETQKITPLDDESLLKRYSPNQIASILKEMGNYMVKYHGDIAFGDRIGWKYDDDDNLCIYSPKMLIRMKDMHDKYALVNELKEVISFVMDTKGNRVDRSEAMNAKIVGIQKAIRDVDKLSDSIIQIGGIMERIDVHSKEYENLLPRYSHSLYMINRKKSAVVKRINNFSRDYGGGERFTEYDEAINYFNKFVSEQNKTE